jgi:DNA-binding transcriptional regulator YiaG
MGQQARDSSKQHKSQTTCSSTSTKDNPQSNEDFHKQLIGQLVKRRQKLNISQRTLGEIIGITDYLLAKWEGGHRRPSGFLLWCWAESLGVKLVIEEANE